jgi:hypothetical protein
VLRRTLVALLASLSLALCLSLSACGGGDDDDPGDAATNRPDGSAAPEAYEGYLDFLYAKVASGDWTEGEGLISILDAIINEEEPDTGDKPVLAGEIGGVLSAARNYLAAGSGDETERDNLHGILDTLETTQEELDAVSVPFGSDPDALAYQVQDLSAGLSGMQTPTSVPYGCPEPGPTACLEYERVEVGDDVFVIYYPVFWRNEPAALPAYEDARDAVVKSVAAYDRIGFRARGSANIIFLPRTGPVARTGGRVLADAWQDTFTDLPCRIQVYRNLATDTAALRQSVAHEIAHCYQYWNYPGQMDVHPDHSGWWMEGSAEYFSNLVYPADNFEYRFTSEWESDTKNHPLEIRSYSNFLFFQYLDNVRSPAVVAAFPSAMPTSPGRDRQIAALAAYPGIQEIFHGFAEALLFDYPNDDTAIFDTNASDRISVDVKIPEFHTVPPGGTIETAATPFRVHRYTLIFQENRKVYDVATSATNGHGQHSARDQFTQSGYAPFPSRVDTCPDQHNYVVVVTSVASGFTNTVEVSEAQTPAGQDPCTCPTGAPQARALTGGPVVAQAALVRAAQPSCESPTPIEPPNGGDEPEDEQTPETCQPWEDCLGPCTPWVVTDDLGGVPSNWRCDNATGGDGSCFAASNAWLGEGNYGADWRYMTCHENIVPQPAPPYD